MPLPKIDAKTAVTVPARAEEVYDKLWIINLCVSTPATDGSNAAFACNFIHYKEDELGNKTPDPTNRITELSLNNMFENLEKYPKLSVAMSAVLEAIIEVGKDKGIIQ